MEELSNCTIERVLSEHAVYSWSLLQGGLIYSSAMGEARVKK